jgi:hypothetical protein
MSTSQIAQAISESLTYARDQLIRMHHLGMIEPIGVREENHPPPAIGYFQDVVWTVTTHTREHRFIEPGCRACKTRTLLLAGAEALDE